MVTNTHEGGVRLFQSNPAVVPFLAKTLFNYDVMDHTRIRTESEALTECNPIELTSDGVEICEDEFGNPVQAFIVEVQRQPDKRKYYTWLGYVASLFARLECPVLLIVICLNQLPAKWARDMCVAPGPPGLMYKPSVIGPDDIPLITEPDNQKYFIDRILLSLLVHGGNPDIEKALETCGRAVSQLPEPEVQR